MPNASENAPKRRLLCLSNGHGEDINTGLIVDAVRAIDPDLEILGMPIVGVGSAYQARQIPLIGPTQTMPSGGIFYMNPLVLVQDLINGLVLLTWRQLQAILKTAPTCDLILATGDVVVITLAWLTRRPFVVYFVATSSYYEGEIRLSRITQAMLQAQRCLAVLTRDELTAQDLRRRGVNQAQFVGNPFMDGFESTPSEILQQTLTPAPRPIVCLLPGSRMPEAADNLVLLLPLVAGVARSQAVTFVAALVKDLTPADLATLAQAHHWQILPHPTTDQAMILRQDQTAIHCYYQSFAALLPACDLVWGMAGTAVEQAVGLGKPVLQVPGPGPQYTYRFAEAQRRLLGPSVTTLTPQANLTEKISQASRWVTNTWSNPTYLQECQTNGQTRLGQPGGSQAMAKLILEKLKIPRTPQQPKPHRDDSHPDPQKQHSN